MLYMLDNMLKAQESDAKWEAFQDTVAIMATIENNQQAVQEDFRDVQ